MTINRSIADLLRSHATIETTGHPGKNLVINGNFDIWQRGGGNFTTGNEYTADRWKWSGTSGSGSVSRQAFTVGQTDVPGNPTYYWRSTVGTGDTNVTVYTGIEGVGHGAGVPCTVSLWAKASETTGWLTGDAGCNLQQRFGSGGSGVVRGNLDEDFASQSITTSWQKFVCTVTPPSISGKTVGAGNYLELLLQTDPDLASSATLDIAQVQVELGSAATDFAHEDIGTTLQKCYRYFERLGPDEGSEEAMVGAGMATGATTGTITINYMEKRAIPTVSIGDVTKFYVQTSTASRVTTAVAATRTGRDRCGLTITFASGSGAAANDAIFLRNVGGEGGATIDLSAEL